ncbi:cytochrome [Mycobacterium florentinum]|uniref:Cytochrome n=1 Tax=Mycobacterium florentinum TaxID=292462 RepID=A0A1X1UF87_MYCFL|nr:cytochrome P450 [Mycobacterium florentinum]MCV7411714.1 cytochrome P450 [Mycobacterium florentinum]ORV55470.1 cytochrome [Mycobacterium florentinum]BBX81078.1 cytochrome P450 [Mycobacterium florentinum]
MQTSFPLHSPDFYAGDPYPVYRQLRASAPVCWNDVAKFWALLRYDDIRFVSTNPALFTSTRGINIPAPGLPNPVQQNSLIFMDPPRHRQLRTLINCGFTRRQAALLEPTIREIVGGILDGVTPGSVHDFIDTIAAPLPARVIAALLGVGRDDWEQFRAWTDTVIGTAQTATDLDPFETGGRLFHCVRQLIAVRDAELFSVLSDAQSDGHRLSDEELLDFSFLLLASGNETTRSLLALGTEALIAHPDQRRLLVEDPAKIAGAVEEMLRWTSPVTHMARTATAEVEIRGQRIAEGDMVVLLYGSANRDEEVFGSDSEEFRVTRSPNPHIAFGCGEHACVGAQLARLTATVFFGELLDRFPDVELAGAVHRMPATMLPLVTRMPVRFGS